MRLDVVFCEVLQPQNVIFFIFYEILVPLNSKTADVNNSLQFLLGMKELKQFPAC